MHFQLRYCTFNVLCKIFCGVRKTLDREEIKDDFTGDVKDKEGNEYYLITDKKQTGWVTVGQEIRYYDEDGVREKVTVEAGEHTCIIDTVYTYTSESGKEKVVKTNDAGGHDYVETDGKYICSVCGWQRVKLEDCDVSLKYKRMTYNGDSRRPDLKITNPITGEFLSGKGTYADFNREYVNDIEIGTAGVVLKARRYGTYVNINDWRGNYEGSTTVYYEICPDAPKNAVVDYDNDKATLLWEAADYAEQYVIYQSTNGGKTYKEIGTTTKTEYTVADLDKEATWIVNEPLIMREEGSGTRKEAEKQLKKIGVNTSKLNVIASMENPEAIKRAVASGMGISLMSRLAAEEELRKGNLLAFPISDEDMRRDINLIYNRNLQLSRSADRLVKVVKEMYKKKDRSVKVE